MKFLQEMIAKKRESQQGLEGEDFADHEDMEDDMASHEGFEDGMDDPDGYEMEAEEAYDEGFEDDDEDEDDSDLFEDESYDWEFEGAETADLSDDAVAADQMHAPEDNDYDDDDDIDAGVANVLREVAGKSPAPELPEPGEPAVASRLEENVEKLRIQRKIWDLEGDDDGVEAAAEPMDEDDHTSDDADYAEADADVEAEMEADADFEEPMFEDDHEDVAMDEADAEDEAFEAQHDATYEDADGDVHDIDFDSQASSAAAMSALRAQNPRVQSKSELRREPAPRREQAQMPRMAASDAGDEMQGDAMRPKAGRVKTRLLGFNRPEDKPADPFAKAAAQPSAPQMDMPSADPQFPVGWLIVLDGPGRGASFTLSGGVSKIGRGQDQAVRLDYGDTSISRDNHAAIAYDEEKRTFFIGHGGKANLVRLNDMPVLSTETIAHDDLIRIGETTLRFIALCGPEFSWDMEGEAGSPHEAAE